MRSQPASAITVIANSYQGRQLNRPNDVVVKSDGSIYFTDPNGIALEASWWVVDATGRPADYGDDLLFSDPDPVPAVEELRREGRLASVPATRLS